jgi:hypothetical protein
MDRVKTMQHAIGNNCMQSRKSSLSCRGRSAIVWGLAIFVAVQLSLAAAIELSLPQLRDPVYGDKLHQINQRIAAARAGSELVVMLGSSRTVHGLDAASLEEQLAKRLNRPATVYNFGIPGAGPFTELVCLQRLLSAGIRPQLVLIEVLPPMLAGQTPTFDLGQYPADRLWRREIPLIERYTSSVFPDQQLRLDWWCGWWSPAFTHRFPIMRAVCPLFVPPEGRGHLFAKFDPGGWNAMPDEARTPQRHEAGLKTARQEYEYLLTGFRLGGASCQALEELLETCRKEGLAAALVVMPEGDAFRSWYPANTWRQIDLYLQSVSSRFSAPLINGREWVAEQNFLDSHHLLSSGARVFSRRLGQCAAPLVERIEIARRGALNAN